MKYAKQLKNIFLLDNESGKMREAEPLAWGGSSNKMETSIQYMSDFVFRGNYILKFDLKDINSPIIIIHFSPGQNAVSLCQIRVIASMDP